MAKILVDTEEAHNLKVIGSNPIPATKLYYNSLKRPGLNAGTFFVGPWGQRLFRRSPK
jgi:hypothetical protein